MQGRLGDCGCNAHDGMFHVKHPFPLSFRKREGSPVEDGEGDCMAQVTAT